MSPQEAAKTLGILRTFIAERLRLEERLETTNRGTGIGTQTTAQVEALNLAIAALECEAKAEPVAWLLSDAQGFTWATTDKEIAEFSVSRTCNLVTPLYASPPAPEKP